MKKCLTLLCGFSVALCAAAEYKPEPWNLEAREQFAKQRFGIFIVWGIYANYAQGEWYLQKGKLDRDAYERMVYGFYPSKYDAREWARTFRKAGAKYVTITARHHDGFALWPSKVDDYNISATPFKRDIIGELAEACREEGLQLNLYYSLLDWHRKDYVPGRAYLKVPVKGMKSDYASYKRYMMGQIAELLDNYHPGNIWFDGEWDHYGKDIGGTFDWEFDDIFDLIHSRKVLVANNNHHSPRPEGCDNGVVDRCELWTSPDGKEWKKSGEGSFPDVMESRVTRTVRFSKPVKARYFRFVATHSLPNNDRLAVAEVDLF